MRVLTGFLIALLVMAAAAGTCLAGAYADGLQHYERGDYARAEKALGEAVRDEADPRLQHQALARLGLVQIMRGNGRAGLPNLEAALQAAPDDEAVLNIYGMGMLTAREYAKALPALERAHAMSGDPQSLGLARLAQEGLRSTPPVGGVMLASAADDGGSQYRGKITPLPKFPPAAPASRPETPPAAPPADAAKAPSVQPAAEAPAGAPADKAPDKAADSPASAGDSFYTVQTGSWRAQERAVQAAEKLAKAGFPAFVVRRGEGPSASHLAVSGRFPQQEQAQAHRQELLAKAGVAGAVSLKVNAAHVVWQPGGKAAAAEAPKAAAVEDKPAAPAAPAPAVAPGGEPPAGVPSSVVEKAKALAEKQPAEAAPPAAPKLVEAPKPAKPPAPPVPKAPPAPPAAKAPPAPQAAPAAVPAPRLPGNGTEFYSVLAGSLKDQDRAVAEAKKLAAAGRPAFVYRIEDSRGVWFRIMCGRFASMAAAKAYADELRRTPGAADALALKVSVPEHLWPSALPPVK